MSHSDELAAALRVPICCLCGELIDSTLPENDPNSLTREHVPPQQFFPKALRPEIKSQLWTAPSHRSCNVSSRMDEEYFYHVLAIPPQGTTPRIGRIIFDDLKRRARQPQTPAMIRKILANARTITQGGIILPPHMVELTVELYRLEQVALKVAQCLFFRDYQQYLPKENCKDIRPCDRLESVPEFYQITWQISGWRSICPEVFTYCGFEYEPDKQIMFSMLFWQSTMFCLTFDDPRQTLAEADKTAI